MYNEISTVASTAAELVREMDAYCERSGDTYEIIFSDDGSRDGTLEAVPSTCAVGAVHGEVVPLGSEVNRGKGAAVRRAVAVSTGDVVMYTDCDLAYGTEAITQGIDVMKKDSPDLLAGSRAIHPTGYAGYTFLRRIASKAYIRILTLITGLKVTDSQCGFKLFSGELARKIFAICETDGWAFDLELFLLAKREGAVMSEMPVTIVNHRESRISVMSDSFKMLREIFKIKARVAALDKNVAGKK